MLRLLGEQLRIEVEAGTPDPDNFSDRESLSAENSGSAGENSKSLFFML